MYGGVSFRSLFSTDFQIDHKAFPGGESMEMERKFQYPERFRTVPGKIIVMLLQFFVWGYGQHALPRWRCDYRSFVTLQLGGHVLTWQYQVGIDHGGILCFAFLRRRSHICGLLYHELGGCC